MQVAVNALLAGEQVTWIGMIRCAARAISLLTANLRVYIETAQPLAISRLISILTHLGDADPHSTLYSLRIIKCPTLAHLLAIILHPPQPTASSTSPSTFPEAGTGVLVIDNISTLFSIAFPPGIDGEFLDRKTPGVARRVQPSVKRFGIMVSLVEGLGKVAGMRNIVVRPVCRY